MGQERPQENIMAVRRDVIFRDGAWDGINPNFFQVAEIVRLNMKFIPRWNEDGKKGAEEDSQWIQIIPFGIIASQSRIFTHKKSSRAGDSRVRDERWVGIGGHLRQMDTVGYGSLLGWFQREWDEEIQYKGMSFVYPVGALYETSRDVSAMHLGFVFLLYGDELKLTIRAQDEITEARWLSLDELDKIRREEEKQGRPSLLGWNIPILDYLNTHRGLLVL